MRSQDCRAHIDKAAEYCGLDQNTVNEVKQAAQFCSEPDKTDFSVLATKPIIALIRVKDDNIRERAISLAKNALNLETPTGGKKNKKLTEKDIRKIIDKAVKEIRMESSPNVQPKLSDSQNKLAKNEDDTASSNDPQNGLNDDNKPKDEPTPAIAQPQKSVRSNKDELERTIKAMLSMMPSRFQRIVDERMDSNPEQYPLMVDVIAAALDCISEKYKE